MNADDTRRPARLAGILFDKDGTLVDFHRTWSSLIRRATAHAAGGDPELTDRLLDLGGMDPETGITRADTLFASGNTLEIVEAFLAAGAPLDRQAMIHDLDAFFIGAAASAVPIADTPDVFGRLRRRGLRLGVASSDNASSIAETAKVLGIAEHVEFIAGYDSGHGVKPNAGMFLAFCAAVGLAPDTVAMVGDNRHDMEMGRAAGAGMTIAVLSGTGTRETLAPVADICLESIADLPALLDSIGVDLR